MSPFVKVAVFAGAVASLSVLIACSGGQGDECSSDSDCHSTLQCQPIKGRAKNYCCPTPAESSDYGNCHEDLAAELAAQKAASSSTAK
jgi:hypothetical protein